VRFPLFLGIGVPTPRPDGRGTAGSSIPYSIYISQFQTGTPKPRYIGFRDGGRETGTQNGQFRPVFGHILRPLSDPPLFHEIRALEHVFLLFLLFMKSELQTPSRTWFLGWVSGAVWSSFPGAATRLGSGKQSGGVSGGCLEQLPRKLLQTAPDCHQTGAMVWSLTPTRLHLAQVRVAKLASLLKSPQPVMACHDRLG
jgi:hypothetical protein